MKLYPQMEALLRIKVKYDETIKYIVRNCLKAFFFPIRTFLINIQNKRYLFKINTRQFNEKLFYYNVIENKAIGQ